MPPYERNISARTGAAWFALAVAVFAYYLGLATRFDYTPWPTTTGGFVFNSQLRALLEGRLDIEPHAIGNEGFERGGKTYTYFGIWPALLRLPVATQLWRDWTTLSCVGAATIAAVALVSAAAALMRSSSPLLARATGTALAASFVLSGPQIELLGKPSVYVEAVLWAYACACLYLAAAIPLLLGRKATTRRLTVLASCAAIALLARVSTGLALYAAFCGCACVLAWRWHRNRDGAGIIASRLLPALVLLAAAAAATATVNTLRWGQPLEFAPLSLNRYYASDPARLARLARHGTFSPERIPDALTYYAAPGWFFAAPPGSARTARIEDLFDGPEGPPIGIPQAQGLWLALALLGAAAVVTRCAGSPPNAAMIMTAVGFALGPLVIMSYHYLAFRYRAEFAPLILFGALLGLRTLQPRMAQFAAPLRVVVFGLAIGATGLQIAQAHVALRAYACTPMGSFSKSAPAMQACLSATTGSTSMPEKHDEGSSH